MINLNEKMLKLLSQSLNYNRPDLLWVVETEEMIDLDEELGNELRDAVNDEFVRIGLKPNDEPNDLGLKLEELIDQLGRLSMGKS